MFNGQEKVNEMAGIGNHNTAQFWEYDTRVARRWNLDPVDQINISNYAANRLNPIWYDDPDGDCPNCKDKPSGWVYTVQRNDNLTKIAKEHGMTIAQIKCINNLSPESDLIHTGQQLKIEYTSPDWMKGPQGATEVGLLEVPVIMAEALVNELGSAFGLDEETSGNIGKATAIVGGLVRGNPKRLLKELDDFVESGTKSLGRSGKQKRMKDLANDDKLGSSDRGWIKQEQNQIKRGKRKKMRNPPGKDMAHKRGKEAAKGHSYSEADLQTRELHKLQHKYDNFGRKNKPAKK